MNYKDDMDGPKFEAFLREVCRRAIARYGTKVALVMDNASYHTILVCTDVYSLWYYLLVHNHFHSFTKISIHSQSFPFFPNHFHSFSNISILSQSFTFIYIHSLSFTLFTIIYVHSQWFIIIHNHLQSLPFLYNHFHLFTISFIHSQ